MLRAGNAGSNTATDRTTVLDQALTQILDRYRHGHWSAPTARAAPRRSSPTSVPCARRE
jgi:hypothetical protein